MQMNNTRVLYSKEKIAEHVKKLAEQINRDYEGKSVLILGTLTGSFIFLADLVRELTIDVEIDFIKVSSYVSTESTGVINIEYTPTLNLVEKHILIIEDIVDTGDTAVLLRQHLANCSAASVKLCVLLDKPARRKIPDLVCEYVGFANVPNEFVVGYGLDCDQRYRQLPYVGILTN